MKKTLQFILKSQIKSSKFIQKSGGFTLIELLVALVLAVLIITPLLGFMINVLGTDRQEQAKASSEQEIQTALNYISRDLQQAVYIYDAAGIEAIKYQLRYPNDAQKLPLLVFWKRELVSNVIAAADNSKDDTFVYSLVVYYLIKDSKPTWSKAARIARWQIKDGVQATSGGVSCTGYDAKYVNADHCPSPGFAPFEEQFEEADSLEQGMNKWKKKASVNYTTDATVLIDHVDQSTDTATRPDATCPPDLPSAKPPITWSKIAPANNITGFYVCVDRANTTAQVFIRGNALARIESDVNKIKYNAGKKTYFPTASVRVQGRGFLFR
ncbi:MAG: prepilin-type N-terminal cleavage/methylation domain-containing protein [Chlorogloeopsis fritschii C42_A2020_084]|uniref:hormogonium polysaccharide secretion pseudopilin HpsC n=1 Tax=Chlorogloeopsis fritschii TaxID=1124 RepID=UPI0019FC36C6|nr:hormogonium polysaccharide secretion pseudopilin HpsC [Chlorogloeopsis fritschii]MBF2004625.1 prepilin-type N-terminal cleavage/methylation domain-containing protein [Chlorogloeopsis fritschii C42_A2020_084]